MQNSLVIFTDGASSGNPGPGWAMWVIDVHPPILKRQRLPHCTNNEAEYLAVIHALTYVKEHSELLVGKDAITFFLDSKLVVEQLAGRWKIKDSRMKEFVQQISLARSEISIPAYFTHIPREKNKADALKYD